MAGKTRKELLRVTGKTATARKPAKSKLGKLRGQFWAFYLSRFPDELERAGGSNADHRWTRVGVGGFYVSQWLSLGAVGVFVRGRNTERYTTTWKRLKKLEPSINGLFWQQALEHAPDNHRAGPLSMNAEGNLDDRRNWPWMAEWLKAHRDLWVERLQKAWKDGA